MYGVAKSKSILREDKNAKCSYLICSSIWHIQYKTQSSSLKDSPRTQTNFLRLWHGKEKTLAVCLEILQDYTAKVFSFSCHADNG